MPRETIYIALKRPELAAACFLATLAYPGEEERAQRQRAVECLLAAFYMRKARGDQKYARTPRLIEPHLLNLSTSTLNKFVNRTRRRLEGRVAAAQLGFMLLSNEISGGSIKFLGRGGRPSLNALATMMGAAMKRPPISRINVVSRVWTRAKPVLHLAIVLNEIADTSGPVGLGGGSVLRLLEGDWVARAIAKAEAWRPVLCSSKKLKIDETKTIQLLRAPRSRRGGFATPPPQMKLRKALRVVA
jgi:hypothetical protein